MKHAPPGDANERPLADLLDVDQLAVPTHKHADQWGFRKGGVELWGQNSDLDQDLKLVVVVSAELLHQGKAAGGAHSVVVALFVPRIAGGLDQRAIDHRPGERAPVIFLDLLEGTQSLNLAKLASLWTAATKQQ